MSGDPLYSESKRERKELFLPEVPQSVRYRKGGECSKNTARVKEEEMRKARTLVDVSGISGELAEKRRLQNKSLDINGLPKRKGWPRRHKVSA